MGLTTTSHAILGLLSIAQMSGYDLHQAVTGSIGHMWPISKSQVYAELARLEPLGLIEATDVPQERLPDKRVFHLTELGEEALDAWLDSDVAEEPQYRLPFLLKTLFGHRRGAEPTAEVLERVRTQALARGAEYEEFLAGLRAARGTDYAQLAVLFGLRLSQAIAAWAEEAQAELPGRRIHIDPRRPHPGTADAMFRIAPQGRESAET